MIVQESDSRYLTHQKYLQFEADKDFDPVTSDWQPYWSQFFGQVSSTVSQLISRGYGVLSVDVQKTNPMHGVLFTAMITYWDKL